MLEIQAAVHSRIQATAAPSHSNPLARNNPARHGRQSKDRSPACARCGNKSARRLSLDHTITVSKLRSVQGKAQKADTEFTASCDPEDTAKCEGRSESNMKASSEREHRTDTSAVCLLSAQRSPIGSRSWCVRQRRMVPRFLANAVGTNHSFLASTSLLRGVQLAT